MPLHEKNFTVKKSYLISPLVCILIFSAHFASAQLNAGKAKREYRRSQSYFGLPKFKRYTSVGLTVNAFNYFGDLAPFSSKFSTEISFTRPGIGLVALRRITNRLSLRGSYTFGRLSGDDFTSANPFNDDTRDRYRRNLHFRNDLHELAITGVFDLFGNNEDFTERPFITPYVFAGIAGLYHNPKARVPESSPVQPGAWVALQPLQTEGESYSKFQLAIPFGLGARLKLNARTDLAVELGFRQLFFDYLDDVSSVYPDLGTLDSELAKILSARAQERYSAVSGDRRDDNIIQDTNTRTFSYVGADGNSYTVFTGNAPGERRGSASENDFYLITSIQLTYILGPRIDRPKHR